MGRGRASQRGGAIFPGPQLKGAPKFAKGGSQKVYVKKLFGMCFFYINNGMRKNF